MSTQGFIKPPRQHSFAGVVNTDGAGNAVFNFVPPFPVAPVIAATMETVVAGNCKVSAVSAASCTVFVGVGVANDPVVGVPVHVIAVPPGRVIP